MLNALLLMCCNLLRTAVRRVCHPGRYKVSWIQRISPRCALRLFDRGTLVVGRNCDFAPFCDFEVHGKGTLTIGEGCYFNRYCMISAHQEVSIGDHCMFGPGVKIFDNNHKHSPETGVSPELTTAPISIGDGCWIASDVIILKGAKIGKNCVIGAGCIVSGAVPDGSVVRVSQTLEIRSRIER